MKNKFPDHTKQNYRNYIQVILLVIYFLFNLVLLIRHEPWRDEANVWLMARDLSPLQLIAELKYQGHPCLWYLFVMPFAKLGFPFLTICVLSFLVMFVTAILFVWKSPLHPITQFFCLISPIFSYFYPVIARNYCLAALIMVLLALLYPRHNEKPVWYGLLLGLLVQTDSIMVASAGLISLMWIWEAAGISIRTKSKKALLQTAKGVWIPFVSVLFLGLQFWNVSDSEVFEVQQMGLLEALGGAGDYFLQILNRLTGQGPVFHKGLVLLFVLAAVLLCVRIWNFWPLIVTAGSFFFEALFSELIYQLHIWHYIAMCFVLLWFVWVAGSKGQSSKYSLTQPAEPQDTPAAEGRDKRKWGFLISYTVLQIVLIVLSISMFIHWNSEEEPSNLANALYGTYSGGKAAAEYIQEHLPSGAVIISTDVARASTVAAYLKDDTFYYAVEMAPRSYATWSASEEAKVPLSQVLEQVKASFPEQRECYILDSEGSCLIETEYLQECELLYKSPEEMARDEHYSLYKISW